MMQITARRDFFRAMRAAALLAPDMISNGAAHAEAAMSAAGPAATLKVTDAFAPAAPGSVRLEGWIGHKLDLCQRNRVMAQDIERVIVPFRVRNDGKTGFRCEFWGKWFTSAALGYAYQPTPEHRAVLDQAVQALLATQSPDGCISTYKTPDQLGTWDVWGRKYVLLGLIAYYDQTGDLTALDAACRLLDYFMTQVGPGKANIADLGYPDWKGLPATSILEPITLLYQRTGNKRYLEFATWIVGQWSKPSKLAPQGMCLIEKALAGTPPSRIAAPKAYEMTSNYEGLCELYRSTGKKKYFQAALSLGESILGRELMVVGSGGNHELWCDGMHEETEILEQPMETCVTATWSKFCFQLLRLTGDPKWADELELTLYNALVSAMTPDGCWWAYHSPLVGQRVPSHYQFADVGMSCCVASGPRALMLVPRWAVMSAAAGPVINLYAPGETTTKLADGSAVKLTLETTYPESDAIKLSVAPERAGRFTLRLRIPAWSRQTSLKVNGTAVKVKPGAYASITRRWAAGDHVELRLDLRGRAVAAPSGAPALAVARGPVVLALDNRLNPPRDLSVRLKANADGTVDLKPISNKPADIWMAFEAPFESHPIHVKFEPASLVLCDYASAGNQWSETNLYRTWLPQPLFLRDAFVPDTWRIMYPDQKDRPQIPTDTSVKKP